MKKTLIYDLPTRLFHWSFATLFLGAFFIVNVFEEESSVFPYHMMMGLVLGFIILLRIIWGVLGTKYARFSSYVLSPAALLYYMKGVFFGKAERKLGRNPASSWAALIMISLATGLAITGFLMSSGRGGDDLEDIHELLADGFFVMVVFHVAGIVLHTLRHKESIGHSMVHGHKDSLENGESGIRNHHIGIGALFIFLTVFFMFFLGKNYNPNQQILTLFGIELQLHEVEDYKHDSKTKQSHEKDDDDDDDDDDD